MNKTYEQYIDEEQSYLALAGNARQNAKRAKQTELKTQGIKAWRGYTFESSSTLTPDFEQFAKDYKRELKKLLVGFSLVSFSRGHFYCSAFFRNDTTGKLVYLNCSDVRFSSDDWYSQILIRTAQHDKDYTGGANCFATLDTLLEKANTLTK